MPNAEMNPGSSDPRSRIHFGIRHSSFAIDMSVAIIIGAGIGGLAAAIALRGSGWDVRVVEQASSPRELGFALALAPNALAALRELGLKDDVLPRGVQVKAFEVRRPDGRVARRVDLRGDAVQSI